MRFAQITFDHLICQTGEQFLKKTSGQAFSFYTRASPQKGIVTLIDQLMSFVKGSHVDFFPLDNFTLLLQQHNKYAGNSFSLKIM